MRILGLFEVSLFEISLFEVSLFEVSLFEISLFEDKKILKIKAKRKKIQKL